MVSNNVQCRKFDIQPRDYPLDLQAMTKEKLKFQLPIVFTIGPDINDRGGEQGDALAKYAMLLADSRDDNFIHVSNIVKGIIEGEVSTCQLHVTNSTDITSIDPTLSWYHDYGGDLLWYVVPVFT